jgi:hypothetical protein
MKKSLDIDYIGADQRDTILNAIGIRFLIFVGVMLFASVLPDSGMSSVGPIDQPSGIFHNLTHLHPIAYVILTIIFLLSVLNLVFQGFITSETWPIPVIMFYLEKRGGLESRGIRGLNKQKKKPGSVKPGNYEDGVVGVRRIDRSGESIVKTRIATPLDGINHRLPQFGSSMNAQTGAPRILDSKTPNKQPITEFKFTSAVDIPTSEELERREKEQLSVSGIVKSHDGAGLGSVIVYLADENGNRVGQSCRSNPQTGEFKVLINEPGAYTIGGYKRGFVMENRDPLVLPVRSGRLDGFSFSMLPEGCTVQGRVYVMPDSKPVANLEVSCICGNGELARSGVTNAAGEFRISGVIQNSKCFLEIVENGSVVARSQSFETVQKREIIKDIILQTDEGMSNRPESESEDNEEEKAKIFQERLQSAG